MLDGGHRSPVCIQIDALLTWFSLARIDAQVTSAQGGLQVVASLLASAFRRFYPGVADAFEKAWIASLPSYDWNTSNDIAY